MMQLKSDEKLPPIKKLTAPSKVEFGFGAQIKPTMDTDDFGKPVPFKDQVLECLVGLSKELNSDISQLKTSIGLV